MIIKGLKGNNFSRIERKKSHSTFLGGSRRWYWEGTVENGTGQYKDQVNILICPKHTIGHHTIHYWWVLTSLTEFSNFQDFQTANPKWKFSKEIFVEFKNLVQFVLYQYQFLLKILKKIIFIVGSGAFPNFTDTNDPIDQIEVRTTNDLFGIVVAWWRLWHAMGILFGTPRKRTNHSRSYCGASISANANWRKTPFRRHFMLQAHSDMKICRFGKLNWGCSIVFLMRQTVSWRHIDQPRRTQKNVILRVLWSSRTVPPHSIEFWYVPIESGNSLLFVVFFRFLEPLMMSKTSVGTPIKFLFREFFAKKIIAVRMSV